MKTLYPYYAGKMQHASSHSIKKSILFILFIVLSLLSFAGGGTPKLDFKDFKLESGVAGKDGAIYRFENVDADIDALLKIKGRSDALVYLVTPDMKTSGFDKALQPQVGYNNGTAPGPADWWMDFEITFVKKGTTQPIIVDEFALSGIDIDGNGDRIREYVSFYGLNSYTLEENSILVQKNLTGLVNGVSQTIGTRFDGPTVNFMNIDTNGTAVMVNTKFLTTNTFTIRAGGVSTGVSGASERMYSFYFKDFNFTKPSQVILPVTLKSFNATLNSGKAVLNWVAWMETGLSHYLVERSYDGKDFDAATMIFANGENGSQVSYSYSETIRSGTSGLVYYRLKMMDADGAFKYSAVKIIRLGGKSGNVAVTSYPNPVTSELRITIPAQWQDQKVVYDMFNTSGQIVKHYVSNKASQTEILQVNDIQPGAYVIKLRAGDESAVQQIVKSR